MSGVGHPERLRRELVVATDAADGDALAAQFRDGGAPGQQGHILPSPQVACSKGESNRASA